MIIVLIILFTAVTIAAFFYMEGLLKWLLGLIGLLLLTISIVGLVYHDNNHWGMKQITRTTTTNIYTAGDPTTAYGLLVKQPLGSASANYILMYRTNPAKPMQAHLFTESWTIPKNPKDLQTQIQHYLASNTVESAKKTSTYELVSADKAQRVVRTTRYEFNSGLAQFLFGIGGEQGDLVKQTTTVEVPRDTWLVLTQAQLEQLTQEAPTLEAQLKAQLAADPQKALALEQLQATDPAGYVKLQVQQFKQLLGIH